MTVEDTALATAAELLHAHIGLKPDPSFRPRLYRALRDLGEARALDHSDLVAQLRSDPEMLDDLLDRVTVQETAFFRHPEQFEAAIEQLLPTMSTPLRAWSAACANGQEAYSLAMMLSSATPAGSAPPSVLATDISPAALVRTASGRYAEREITGVSEEQRSRYMTRTPSGWTVRSEIRRLLTVRRHNLLDPIPEEVASCQIVMCRNVMIYFSEQHAESFLDRLADVIDKDAFVFVGGAETLWQVTDRFDPVQLDGCFVYRRRSPRHVRSATSIRTATPVVLRQATAAPMAVTTMTVPTQQPRIQTPANSPAPSPAPPPPTPRSIVPSQHALQPVVLPQPAERETPSVLEQAGHAAIAAGDTAAAIVAFRRWAYSTPDDPAAHFHLGASLDTAGESARARRAYRAAIAALDRSDGQQRERLLQGYDIGEFRKLLVDLTASDEAPTSTGTVGPRQRTTVGR